jgi:hypothetical protein
MGGGASSPAANRGTRRGPLRTPVTKLDTGTKAADLLDLRDQDAARRREEEKDTALLELLSARHAAATGELAAQLAAAEAALASAHEVRVQALYAECTGLFTAQELRDVARSGSPGEHSPSPPELDTLSNRQAKRLVELGVLVTAFPAGEQGGLHAGLRAMQALETTHLASREELGASHQLAAAAASLRHRYESTALMGLIDERAARRAKARHERGQGVGEDEQDGADDSDAALLQRLSAVVQKQLSAPHGRCRCGEAP